MGGLYLSGHYNAGHPQVGLGGAPEQGPHARTKSQTQAKTTHTLLTWGLARSLLLSIKFNHSESVWIHCAFNCVSVYREKKGMSH